jgi:hypothetical protein
MRAVEVSRGEKTVSHDTPSHELLTDLNVQSGWSECGGPACRMCRPPG